MTSKANYLKKYLSREGENKPKKKKKSTNGKRVTNLSIHDDDIDWKSILPVQKKYESDESDPDTKPVIASIKDESVKRWVPVESSENAAVVCDDLSPIRYSTESTCTFNPSFKDQFSDLSPTRSCEDADLSPLRESSIVHTRQPNSPSIIINKRDRLSSRSPKLKRSRLDSTSPSEEIHSNSLIPSRIKSDDLISEPVETVYRDRNGTKLNSKLEKVKKKEKERKQDEADEKFMEWGRG